MKRRVSLLFTLLLGCCETACASDANKSSDPGLNCELGPLQETYAATPWLVYGCDDGHSIVVITASDNPALPFYFFFVKTSEGMQLHGEGTGDKKITDAAFEELKKLTDSDVANLYQQTAAIGRATKPQ